MKKLLIIITLFVSAISLGQSANYNEVENPLIVFPNPTESSFTIFIKNGIPEKGMLEVSDLSGRLIYQRAVNNIANPIEVQIKDYPQGVYIIQIKGSNRLWQGQVVKI